jgi:DNA-binding winged helix-turn-helix (wHTH) protein/Tol biopolymer transport system component
MAIPEKSAQTVRFGKFALDLRTRELRNNGQKLTLQEQPFQILAALLERPGQLVERDELTKRLWPSDTFVDFEHSLNKAVNRLREALEDSAERPYLIETLPRLGYRFIAPVQADGVEQLELVAPVNGNTLVLAPPDSKPSWRAVRLIGLGLVVLAACLLLYHRAFPPPLRVTQITRLTNSGRLDPWGGVTSDGSRIFFLEREGDHWNDRQISAAGGESMPFGSSGRNMRILAVTTDQSEILFTPFTSRIPNLPLWSMPLVGGGPRRIGDILANAATFSPDGTTIAFANDNGVFLANRDGSGVRQLAALPECWGVAWSPDGKILRFSSHGSHLWQVTSAGLNLHPFLPAWKAWGGRWTSDGSYYTFTASKDGRLSLWALRESAFLPWMLFTPTQLTVPPVSYDGAWPSRDGHVIFAHGGLSEQFDVVRFDPVSNQLKPVLPTFNVNEVEFSPDHQWMLYSNWIQLWRSRPDGSDRLQLAGPPSIPHNYFAHWSPDSKRILFEDLEDDKGTIYLVSADGGPAQQPLPPGPSRRGPTWSADGKAIAFSIEEEAGETSSSKQGIYLFDLAQGHSTLIAGSRGLVSAHSSPDGRFLVAVSEDGSVIKLLDFRTHRWSEVARGKLIAPPVWSADSTLYFQDMLAPGEPVYRFQPGASGPRRVYSFEGILQSGAIRCAFWGFAPDGSLLVQVGRGGGDVYALTVSAR